MKYQAKEITKQFISMSVFSRCLDILDKFIHLPSMPYLHEQGVLEKIMYTLIRCHCRFTASNLSWALDEASGSCCTSSVGSSSRLSQTTDLISPPSISSLAQQSTVHYPSIPTFPFGYSRMCMSLNNQGCFLGPVRFYTLKHLKLATVSVL